MANLAPALLLGVGIAVVLGGRKKRKTSTAAAPSPGEPWVPGLDEEPIEDEEPEGEAEPDTPSLGSGTSQTVAKGIRKDRSGHHPWRIVHDSEGFRAQLMSGVDKFARKQEELGVAASEEAARAMLRDTFNERLIALYPNEPEKNDPPDALPTGRLSLGN